MPVSSKTLLSNFCILRTGETRKRSGKCSYFPLKVYSLSGKVKLLTSKRGTFVKQMEDSINYEMYSPLSVKI